MDMDAFKGTLAWGVERDNVVDWIYQQSLTNYQILSAILSYLAINNIEVTGVVPKTNDGPKEGSNLNKCSVCGTQYMQGTMCHVCFDPCRR